MLSLIVLRYPPGTLPHMFGSKAWPPHSAPPLNCGNVTDGFDPVPTKDGDYSAFYAGVAAAVRGAAAPPVAPSDTLAVLDVIDAARRSAPDHQLIQLEA